MNKFQIWAAEINKDWTPGYSASATEEVLSVTFNGELVATVDTKLKVTGEDMVLF
jgi:hypothetical protein